MHSTEAFGPVISVIGYNEPTEAVELAAKGAGSLVASVITHDDELAALYGRGIAAYHGRVHFLDRPRLPAATPGPRRPRSCRRW